MKSYHIHIGGLVQGVGFRPFVYRLAKSMEITGRVSNTTDGVHITITTDEKTAKSFYTTLLQSPPANAVITKSQITPVPAQTFTSFEIITGDRHSQPDLLLTPDFALCENCRQELADKGNRRYGYPFITCLQCGPRYSIIRELPYDREHTTMQPFALCPACRKEYENVNDRRHYSQTNSCPDCAITLHLFTAAGQLPGNDPSIILKTLQQALTAGQIAAVKGIGGYLLLCDAANEAAIQTLRKRKHRPAKPFALLYDNIERAQQDVYISDNEKKELLGRAGPIVLCRLNPAAQDRICTEAIAPGLDKIGLQLPSTPLLQLIATAFEKPLIATSANISGSPIIFKDEDALALLPGIADCIITHDREILLPQDDSVLLVSENGTKIIIRRSRGLAPNYFPDPFATAGDCILAMGGELKSAFALQAGGHLYISQYLGNPENLAAQSAYVNTARHFLSLLQLQPSLILADKHPGYFVSRLGSEITATDTIPQISIQHHEAHFGAVLAENNLLYRTDPVLGIIWDGAGYGDDGQIWGGEFFILRDGEMERVAHLDYFPQLLGEKMNREPRLSALSLLRFHPAALPVAEKNFSPPEWQYYQQLVQQRPELLTSSMGRLLDGLSSLLGICQVNTYEGEAAMKLEAAARNYTGTIPDDYPLPLRYNRLDPSFLLRELLADLEAGKETGYIAKKVFYSLATAIGRISDHFGTTRIAFSGGVFQNALLADMIGALYSGKKKLYWHRQLSPNDECISLGQLACYQLMNKKRPERKFGSARHRSSHYQPVN